MSEKQRIAIVGANRTGKSRMVEILAALAVKYQVEVLEEIPRQEFEIIARDECCEFPAMPTERRSKSDRKRNKRNRWN